MYDFEYDLSANDLKTILFHISNEDCSSTRIQTLAFSDLLNPKKFNGKFSNVEDQLEILYALIDSGLKLNTYDTTGNWTYGHYLIREGSPKIIKFAIDNNFDFDLLTDVNEWHSISLLCHNMVRRTLEETKEILDIIDNKIDTIDFETINFPALLNILNKYYINQNEIVGLIMDKLDKHENYRESFNARLNMILHNYENLIPQSAKDVFIF